MLNMIRFEDRLEGANNFTSWKVRIMMILIENILDQLVKNKDLEPGNEPVKFKWIEHNEKAMKLIVDVVRDHIVPILAK